ncbi:hypothetical protein HMPREF3032_01093 [Veillonella sp. DNF00869]|nr:hypothetical protein HMPREF3032_01093 [Veillonella sp. DNF00869]
MYKKGKFYLFFLLIMAMVGSLYLYVNIHRYLDTKIFFRYEITFVFELRDYFNQRTLENEMFTYVVKNDTLYVYGLSGYTKVKLGMGVHIIKILNPEYESNYIPSLDARGPYYSSIDELRQEYGSNLMLEHNFGALDDTDIATFVELLNETRSRESSHYSFLEDSGDLYKDGKMMAQGLRILNDALIGEHFKRN